MKSRLFVTALISAVILGVTPNSSSAADTSAPVLVTWKLIDAKTDISTGDGKLRIEFSISDESRIEDPLSSLSSQSTTQQSGFAFPTLISKIGNVSTYRSEATISFGKAPGLWRWLLFPLRDSLGNSSNGFGPGGSWPVEVWVYDKDFTEAKRLATEAKATADAKAIADKAAADANRREQIISSTPFRTGSVPFSSAGLPTKIASSSNLPVFAYNSTNEVCVYENGVIKTKTSGRCVIAFSQEGNSEFKPASNLVLDFVLVSTTKKLTTITCTKGKLIKKVTAVKPKCPAGYNLKK